MIVLILAIALLVLLGMSMLLMPIGKAQTRKRNSAEHFSAEPRE